jgi:tRNA nucleotidyltransferase (CCA-adding enzyme)
MRLEVPRAVLHVLGALREAGHRAFVVGGGVRDALLPGVVTDPVWDVATSAVPEEVQRLFPETHPVGIEHGTVGVRMDGGEVEVTTFRADVETFGRKARVRFSSDLQEDLARRDFTINALAYDPESDELIDPFGGAADLSARVLKSVGDPRRRFEEDYLRLLRGARFVARFDLAVPDEVREAMRACAAGTRGLSGERVRDEVMKTLAQAERPSRAFRLLRETGVLAEILPELDACFGVAQNRWHPDDVGEHTLLVVDAMPRRYPFLRLVALLHDLGKPGSKTWDPEREDYVFRGHDELGARLAETILERLRFPRRDIERAAHLVRVHMDLFPIEAGDAAVRRWLQRVGERNVRDLFRLHFADWNGNRAKPRPALELRALYRRARRVAAARSALKVTDLAIGGDDLRALGLAPGPAFKELLSTLLRRVVEDPSMNERETLLREARALARLAQTCGARPTTGLVDERSILELGERIARDFRPDRIILFGSYAYGDPTPDSDVDILVILPFEGRGFSKSLEILNRLDPPFSVELLARRPEDTDRRYREGDPLIREAIDRGKVLYERHR